MKLNKIRVRHFQAFEDTGEVCFLDGINLIIGQNNSGKSTVLRAMLIPLVDDRHRTPEKWEPYELPLPRVNLEIKLQGYELRKWLLKSGAQYHFPIPSDQINYSENWLDAVLEGQITFRLVHQPGTPFHSDSYPSHQIFQHMSERPPLSLLVQGHNGKLVTSAQSGLSDTLGNLLYLAWTQDMFYFASERMNIGEASPSWSDRLSSNALNLPNVLHTLSNERGDIFRLLVDHLREVLPTVGNLSVRLNPQSGNFEIRVWPTQAMERIELSFPLLASGTGVSQITAILAAVMTVKNAIILIDEINSFLHPAAVKALLRILQTKYNYHQYIISTHAPEVIGFSNPSTIHLVRRSGYSSTIESLDLEKVGEFRLVAEHLGVAMSDVFAADRVIWVEGQTEELCFPYLHNEFLGPISRGLAVIAVSATGDFNSNRRDSTLVYEIYERLSSATSSLAVSVIFSFDSETLSDSQKEKMIKDSGNRVRFLPRRHIECYVVDPFAIEALILSKNAALKGLLSPESVKLALETAASSPRFAVREWRGDLTSSDWLEKVDAAKLIAFVVEDISKSSVTFSKRSDTVFLLRHIVENGKSDIIPLVNYVRDIFHHVTS